MTDFFVSHIWSHLLVILTFLLTLVLVSQILREHRSPSSTIAWMLSIILVPYIGVPLYLLIGGRKVKRLAAQKTILFSNVDYLTTSPHATTVERLLLSSGVSPKTNQNEFLPLSTGTAAFEEIQRAIRSAKKSVWVSTYVLGNDSVGNSILNALCEKAKEGVQVRLLLDGIGSFWFPRSRLRKLNASGARFALFVPFFHVPFTSRSNLRNHRKMVLVDGSEGVLGGMNLSGDYLGPSLNSRYWKDFSFRIRGEALREFEKLFISDWVFAAGEKLNSPSLSSCLWPADYQTSVQVIPSGPDLSNDSLYDAILTQIFAATDRLWIATPYFIPDEGLTRALELACRRSVDVRIIVPARSNHLLADICRGSYLKQIFASGARICLYGAEQNEMMHAKMILADDHFALVGSANMDMRSLLLNYEVGALLSDNKSVKIIANWFEETFKRTEDSVPKDSWRATFIEGIGRILGPML